MKKILKLSLMYFFSIVIMSGCVASFQVTPITEYVDRFTLNETTYEEVESFFGSPNTYSTVPYVGIVAVWNQWIGYCLYSVQFFFREESKIYYQRGAIQRNC
jgi:hypothetical protein